MGAGTIPTARGRGGPGILGVLTIFTVLFTALTARTYGQGVNAPIDESGHESCGGGAAQCNFEPSTTLFQARSYKPDEEIDLSQRTTSLYRIPNSNDQRIAYTQSISCIDEARHHKLMQWTGNYSHKHKWLHRRDLTCFDLQRTGCFRRILDDFFTPAEVKELYHHLEHYHDTKVFDNAVARIQDYLEGIAGHKLKFVPNYTFHIQDPNEHGITTNWTGLHADYLSSLFGYKWVYTGLMYLSTTDTDHVGGETGFADEMDGVKGGVTEGIVVPAKKGRLLVFTGGAENFHVKLPHSGGKRAVMQIMFDCDDGQERKDLLWDRGSRQTHQVNYHRKS